MMSHDRHVFPLELADVCFASGEQRIIEHVSLAIDGPVRTLILGANGAGKSVLMRLMHGLLTPTSGAVRWCGSAERAAAQAMVFQRPIMLRTTVIENVAYGLKLAGVGRSERRVRAAAALAKVGLADIAERPARVLSGGEQQRVALARAWALEPQILFLDEPTASLDPGAALEVERIIGEIAAGGCKIVMTTHNLGQARRLADEVIFLHHGRVAEYAPASVFFALPRSPEAVSFMKGELP
jgi:tungstate transport system ATP-binding protein